MCTPTLRFFCIVQLCIGFSLFLWALCYPYLGNHYETKKKLLIIESALGDTSGTAWKYATESERATLQKNAKKAALLPKAERESLQRLKDSSLQKSSPASFLSYLTQNPYFFLYAAFSILSPLLILLDHRAKRGIIIFLPLIALCFSFDNLLFAPVKPKTPEEQLFPTEKEIKASLAYEELYTLEQGLEAFLIEKYLNQLPSKNREIRKEQKEEAHYRLLFKRALLQNSDAVSSFPQERKTKGFLFLFLLWNILFSLIAYKEIKKNYTNISLRLI